MVTSELNFEDAEYAIRGHIGGLLKPHLDTQAKGSSRQVARDAGKAVEVMIALAQQRIADPRVKAFQPADLDPASRLTQGCEIALSVGWLELATFEDPPSYLLSEAGADFIDGVRPALLGATMMFQRLIAAVIADRAVNARRLPSDWIDVVPKWQYGYPTGIRFDQEMRSVLPRAQIAPDWVWNRDHDPDYRRKNPKPF